MGSPSPSVVSPFSQARNLTDIQKRVSLPRMPDPNRPGNTVPGSLESLLLFSASVSLFCVIISRSTATPSNSRASSRPPSTRQPGPALLTTQPHLYPPSASLQVPTHLGAFQPHSPLGLSRCCSPSGIPFPTPPVQHLLNLQFPLRHHLLGEAVLGALHG